jgi:ribonuclease HI
MSFSHLPRTGGVIQVQVDASIKEGKTGPAKCGWALIADENCSSFDFENDVLREFTRGEVIIADSRIMGTMGINLAELHAIYYGLMAAMAYTRKEVLIWTDSSKAVKLLTAQNCIRDERIMEIIQKILNLHVVLPFQILKGERKDVSLAHRVASWGAEVLVTQEMEAQPRQAQPEELVF